MAFAFIDHIARAQVGAENCGHCLPLALCPTNDAELLGDALPALGMMAGYCVGFESQGEGKYSSKS